MKCLTLAVALFLSTMSFESCSSSSRMTNIQYFGEGGSSPDTLYVRAQSRPVTLIIQRNYRGGEGGSSPDTLSLKANESARIYKLKDDKDKK